MTAIATLDPPEGPVEATWWSRLAASLFAAWDRKGVLAREAIVLLPHAGLLGPARRAFAQHGGWQPRVETASTLAAALAPRPPGSLDGPTLRPSIDRLAVAQALCLEPFGRAWAERDPRAFDAAVSAIVHCAHALLASAHARPPAARSDWWSAARASLPVRSGAGAVESQLARWALEWAAPCEHEPTAALWSLRPSAWTVVQAGGVDPMLEALIQQAASTGIACWRIDTDPDATAPFDAPAWLDTPALRLAQGFEEEAQGAAFEVLQAIEAGHVPVVLVAEDRLLVRRIRALLERAGAAIADETGWTLSTTRAAGRLMAVLRAAAPGDGRDAVFDALKAEEIDDVALRSLEAAWRVGRMPESQGLEAWHAAKERYAALGASPPVRTLGQWLGELAATAPALIGSLAQDPAGAAVLATLGLDGAPKEAAWQGILSTARLDLAAFTAWVASALEEATYRPVVPGSPQVVITPLARTVLRPFGAAVFPGCDEQHLGAPAPVSGLLTEAQCRELGVPDAQERWQSECLAFAQLLRHPNVVLLRRSHDGNEALARSGLVELMLHARRRSGQPLPVETAVALPAARVAAVPIGRPSPGMADALPARLSASTIEALRDCPYRFFAKAALRLTEESELEADPEMRDRGRWLHAVLHAFHESRRDAVSPDRVADLQRLREAAVRALDGEQLDADAMWPFSAAFEGFALRYLEWLEPREAAGWRYAQGEVNRAVAPPELDGIRIEGRLDRIDTHRDGAVAVIDYKTGSADALRKKTKQPLEDTQLAIYASLLTEEPVEPPPQALYLVLDDRQPPKTLPHPEPAKTAARLIGGLAQDLAALRSGQGAPALGEEPTCSRCEMRGLCRRDHWSGP